MLPPTFGATGQATPITGSMSIKSRIDFFLNRMQELLWLKPAVYCVLSVVAALLTKAIDMSDAPDFLPTINRDTVETLLQIMAASMLVIATFSVASMVAAYSSASRSATPRSFPLILTDDLSQNALSAFVGSFIFSIVALISSKNGYYTEAGYFVLFVVTLLVFAWVVLIFVRWVDGIARLGRLGNTIDKVEHAASGALADRHSDPLMGGRPVQGDEPSGTAIHSKKVGYVQHVRMDALQEYAEAHDTVIRVGTLPGSFAVPGRPLAWIETPDSDSDVDTDECIRAAFTIGGDRVFDEDPRFGLLVLSEIAGRALSSGVNDPGTAIEIVGTFVRLFTEWAAPSEDNSDAPEHRYDRVEVPELCIDDMFNDAFTSIARDGAGIVEVVVRLQKAFEALASLGHPGMERAARRHAELSIKRAELDLKFKEDLETARQSGLTAD